MLKPCMVGKRFLVRKWVDDGVKGCEDGEVRRSLCRLQLSASAKYKILQKVEQEMLCGGVKHPILVLVAENNTLADSYPPSLLNLRS